MKLQTKTIFGKNIKPGDLLVWKHIGEVDIILSLEFRTHCIYGMELTRSNGVEKFVISYDKYYDVATSVRT